MTNRTRRFGVLLAVGVLAAGNSAQTVKAEEAKFVSATFQEILSRVVRRDEKHQAIVQVRRKMDAPGAGELTFAIMKIPHEEEVFITMGANLKTGNGVFETYRLKIDEAIRQELRNQHRMAESEKERVIKESAQRQKNIVEFSGGTLHEGMTLQEVFEIKGQPEQLNPIISSGAMFRLPEFKVVYSDMELTFQGKISRKSALFSIKPRKQTTGR